MRLLTVIAEMGSGGAESIAAQLATGASERGDDVTLATHGGWRLAPLGSSGVDVLPLPRTRGTTGLVASVLRIRRALAARPVDVVHAHNIRATVVARLGSQRRHRPAVVSTVHGLSARRYRPAARILRLLADEVVAVDDDVAARLRAAGLPPDHLHVIGNAPDPVSPMERRAARRDLAIPADVPVVLCLARLEPPKRHDLLLEAWAAVPAPALLLVAGEGSTGAALERDVARLGGTERVRLLGDRRDVGRLLSASDLLVLPSDREGMPLAVLEAMAFGLPVVASRVGGLAGLDPDAVRLVEPGSAPALSRALEQCLADEEGRRRMVERARELVGRRHTVAAMQEGYAALFRAVGGLDH